MNVKIKLARMNNVHIICGQCETRICSVTDVGDIDNLGIFRQLNMFNTSLRKLEFNEDDYFCNFSTFNEHVFGVENYQLYGCVFGHVIAIRFLPNKFTEDMDNSGYYNKVHITSFSNLCI